MSCLKASMAFGESVRGVESSPSLAMAVRTGASLGEDPDGFPWRFEVEEIDAGCGVRPRPAAF